MCECTSLLRWDELGWSRVWLLLKGLEQEVDLDPALGHAANLGLDAVQLLFHHQNQGLPCLMRSILVDEIMNIVEECLKMVNLVGIVLGIGTQEADQLEEIEQDGTCQCQEVRCGIRLRGCARRWTGRCRVELLYAGR